MSVRPLPIAQLASLACGVRERFGDIVDVRRTQTVRPFHQPHAARNWSGAVVDRAWVVSESLLWPCQSDQDCEPVRCNEGGQCVVARNCGIDEGVMCSSF